MGAVLASALGAALLLLGLGIYSRASSRRSSPLHEIEGCIVRFGSPASFTVEPPRPFPPGLAIRPRVAGARPSFKSADPDLDAAIAIEGEERWLAARLSHGVRSGMLQLAWRSTLAVDEGVLRIQCGLLRAEEAEALIAPAVELARWLSEAIDVPEMTAKNAREDPVAAIRRRCLEIAIRDRGAAAKQLASDLIGDPDPEVRLLAAKHVGPKAVRALESLAIDRRASDRVRAQAIAAYVQHEMFDEARKTLARLASEEQPPPVMAALAKAIASIGGEFEPQLIRILEAGDRIAQVEAIIALSRIGTVASVEALSALMKRSGVPDEVRALAKRTVTTLQIAAAGERGTLSVVQGEGGELSASETGALSMKDDGSA